MAEDTCACTCGKKRCASRRGHPHGTEGRYRDGCRCEPCRAVARHRRRGRKMRANSLSQETAVKSGQQWTGPELEMVLRTDMTVGEIAVALGRSRSAVTVARSKARNDPKYSNLVGATTGGTNG